MKIIATLGDINFDGLHLGLIVILLISASILVWLASRRRALEAALQRERSDYVELEADIDTVRRDLAEAQQGAQDAQLQLANLKGQTSKQREEFSDMAQGLLDRMNKQFLERADETFKKHREGAQGELKQLMEPIGENFQAFKKRVDDIEKVRVEDKSVLQAQVKAIGESLHRNTAETGKLVNALTAPKGGGRWGEMTLRNVMEQGGLSSYCDFEEQVSDETEDGFQRPDAVIHLPGARQIVIDSKVSLKAYMDAAAEGDPTQRTVHLKSHADSVRRHIDALASKRYQDNLNDRVDFVAMFIPGENFFAAALEHSPDLLDRAYSKGVIITTPSTLISLAKTVSYVWRQEKMTENAREAAELGQQLYERIATMSAHIERLGKSLNGAVENYNKMNSSLERRVLPTMRKFEELSIAPPEKTITQPKKLDARADDTASTQIDLLEKQS
ncbi:MAG: DNA recombination protein RmuC [Pseudomonadota bacterium]